MDNNARADITNAEVGKHLGLTHAAVSRLRSGDRRPSLAVIKAIETWLGWNVGRQINLLTGGRTGSPNEDQKTWHEAFEYQLRLHADVPDGSPSHVVGSPVDSDGPEASK